MQGEKRKDREQECFQYRRRLLHPPEVGKGNNYEAPDRQHEADGTDSHQDLQIAAVSLTHVIDPASSDVFVKWRETTGLGERSETCAEEQMIFDVRDFRLPDLRPARELGGVFQRARNSSLIDKNEHQ